jgi:hypothetical protein
MPRTQASLVPALTTYPPTMISLTNWPCFSQAKPSCNCHSADILGLKFLPVRSEGSFVVLQSLGDFV